jgi:hypothetical protein
LSVVPGAADVELDGFRLVYVAEDGTQHRLSLADAWTARFEAMSPVRRYRARKGRRHLPGLRWSSTMAGHVGFESSLERDQLMWLDWDPLVIGIVAQPFGCRGPGRAAGMWRTRRISSPAGWTARRWWSTADRWSGDRSGIWPSSRRSGARVSCWVGNTGWSALRTRSSRRPAVAGRVPASSPPRCGVGGSVAGRVRGAGAAAGRRRGGG